MRRAGFRPLLGPPPPPRRPLGVTRRGIREAGLALITLGVMLLLFVTYELFGTTVTEQHHQAALKKSFQAAVAANTGKGSSGGDNPTIGSPATAGAPGGAGGGSPTTTVGPATETATLPGQALDHLVIPKIGVDKYVVEGIGEDQLSQGPGHYPGTPLPGQAGNSGIAGHRTTYGAPFFKLNELAVGDPIYVTDTSGHQYVYKVAKAPFVVSPSDVTVLANTPNPELTLTTCNPRFSATNRLIVVADLAGQPAPPTSSSAQLGTAPLRPVASTANLTAGNGDDWPGVVLYGLLVVIAWVVTRLAINRTRRWRRLGAYVIGIGVCLVPLWFVFENVVRLLPQSI